MFKKIIVVFALFLSLFGLTGCGFVVDDVLEIANINYELLDDGRTKIEIVYVDEDQEPLVFYLPQGKPGVNGENGNGIKSMTSTQSDDGKTTNIHIDFTANHFEPIDIKVPNGISITSVSSVVEEETGNTLLTINYSDGTKSEPIIIPKGEKGDAGVGLQKYDILENEDGSKTIVFTYTDGSRYECLIPVPEKGDPGKDGNYIKEMTSFEDGDKYYISVIFNEGDPMILEFNKPDKPNAWISGNDVPTLSVGREGDYYFDTIHKTIYNRTAEGWVVIVDLDDNDEKYVVTFDLNDKDGNGPSANLSPEYKLKYFISRGQYFHTEAYKVPVPFREGFTFGGWYTTKQPNITNGAFTDLTPVFGDLTLYAKWIKN